ncbi:MAG: acyloxyacyl hydrolase [Bacteroidota bacterium]
MKTFTCIWVCLLLGLSLLPAQSKHPKIQQFLQSREWSVDLLWGNTVKHRESMVFELPKSARSIQIEMARQTLGEAPWEPALHKPRVGWIFSFLDYGNTPVLGTSYSLRPFIDYPLARYNPFSLYGRFGMGLAYNTRTFHPTENPLNNAISSHFNIHPELGLLLTTQLTPHWGLRLGTLVAHQSNSKYKQPNLGLNSLQLRVGITYRHQALEPTRKKELLFRKTNVLHLILQSGLGFKEEKIFGGPTYPVYHLKMGGGLYLGKIYHLMTGFGWEYDRAIVQFIRDHDIQDISDYGSPHVLSFWIGHEFLFRRMGIVTKGFYYMRPNPQVADQWGMYIGPQFYLHPIHEGHKINFYAGVYIKAHKAVADYIQFSIGALL